MWRNLKNFCGHSTSRNFWKIACVALRHVQNYFYNSSNLYYLKLSKPQCSLCFPCEFLCHLLETRPEITFALMEIMRSSFSPEQLHKITRPLVSKKSVPGQREDREVRVTSESSGRYRSKTRCKQSKKQLADTSKTKSTGCPISNNLYNQDGDIFCLTFSSQTEKCPHLLSFKLIRSL